MSESVHFTTPQRRLLDWEKFERQSNGTGFLLCGCKRALFFHLFTPIFNEGGFNCEIYGILATRSHTPIKVP